jgi:uncharacterized protein (DUF924 family)
MASGDDGRAGRLVKISDETPNTEEETVFVGMVFELTAEVVEEVTAEFALYVQELFTQSLVFTYSLTDHPTGHTAEEDHSYDWILADVLSFWVRPTSRECLDLWFGHVPEYTEEVTARFSKAAVAAMTGRLHHWERNVQGAMGLVLLMDFYPRIIYQGTEHMYSGDDMALSVAKMLLASTMIDSLAPKHLLLLCIVLTHAEDLEMQQHARDYWQQISLRLDVDDPFLVFTPIFDRNYAIIETYKRYPHRNKLLGRKNTPAEDAFLKSGDFTLYLPVVPREKDPEEQTYVRAAATMWKRVHLRSKAAQAFEDGVRRARVRPEAEKGV